MVDELLPLKVKGAISRRRGRVLVGPIDLTLEEPGVTVVIGPNGSGKTSLLAMLHGTARMNKGSIEWACDIETARAAQAFVFQRPVMLRRNVRDNIAYPLLMRGTGKTKSREHAEDWAARVGLSGLLERQAMLLSGGEQQKLALARALITSPKLVFLDEPTAALDGRSTREIEDILTAAQAQGTKLILATHDMGQAKRLAREVVFLLHGKIHEHSQADAFFKAPQTPQAQAFLKGDIVE